MRTECAFEQDVLDALSTGRPDPCDPNLRDHISHCAACAELYAVASALVSDYHAARIEAHVPSSGIVWWRAQLRARDEAMRVAARPMTVVHALAASAGAGLACAAFTAAYPWIHQWLSWLAGVAGSIHFRTDLIGTSWAIHGNTLWIAAILLAWLLVAPLVAYFAVSENSDDVISGHS